MADNPIEEFYNVDLTRLNLFGCGLVLATSFCCCGGMFAEFVLLGNVFPEGTWLPKILFIVPILGAGIMFVSGRAILRSNGIGIYRGEMKKKKKKRKRRYHDETRGRNEDYPDFRGRHVDDRRRDDEE